MSAPALLLRDLLIAHTTSKTEEQQTRATQQLIEWVNERPSELQSAFACDASPLAQMLQDTNTALRQASTQLLTASFTQQQQQDETVAVTCLHLLAANYAPHDMVPILDNLSQPSFGKAAVAFLKEHFGKHRTEFPKFMAQAAAWIAQAQVHASDPQQHYIYSGRARIISKVASFLQVEPYEDEHVTIAYLAKRSNDNIPVPVLFFKAERVDQQMIFYGGCIRDPLRTVQDTITKFKASLAANNYHMADIQSEMGLFLYQQGGEEARQLLEASGLLRIQTERFSQPQREESVAMDEGHDAIREAMCSSRFSVFGEGLETINTILHQPAHVLDDETVLDTVYALRLGLRNYKFNELARKFLDAFASRQTDVMLRVFAHPQGPQKMGLYHINPEVRKKAVWYITRFLDKPLALKAKSDPHRMPQHQANERHALALILEKAGHDPETFKLIMPALNKAVRQGYPLDVEPSHVNGIATIAVACNDPDLYMQAARFIAIYHQDKPQQLESFFDQVEMTCNGIDMLMAEAGAQEQARLGYMYLAELVAEQTGYQPQQQRAQLKIMMIAGDHQHGFTHAVAHQPLESQSEPLVMFQSAGGSASQWAAHLQQQFANGNEKDGQEIVLRMVQFVGSFGGEAAHQSLHPLLGLSL